MNTHATRQVNEQVELLAGHLFEGRPRALSRAISWVENGGRDASALLERVYAEAPHPWVIGITGVGGAGKSTLLPALARRLAADGQRVAVLAVDPSSPLTGGALLGDRIRDNGEQHARVFFRSIASRGGHGGLATCVTDLVRVVAAAGFDTVLIETVGAGQSEVAVLDVAHTVLLICAPGLGDDVQAQKAGVMEIADVVVVNKADQPGAEDAVASLRQALRLAEREAHMADGTNRLADGSMHWHAPVLATVALKGVGVQELTAALQQHRVVLQHQGRYESLNRERTLGRMRTYFEQVVQERIQARAEALALWPALHAQLAAGQCDPLSAARSAADRVLGADWALDTPTLSQEE